MDQNTYYMGRFKMAAAVAGDGVAISEDAFSAVSEDEEDCSQLFLQIIIVSIFTKFFY